MRLLINGEEIDLKAPHELMVHLGCLREEQYADMRIETDGGTTMVLLKNGDRALVHYLPVTDDQGFLASSEEGSGDSIEFRHASGEVQQVLCDLTVHVMQAYQAMVYFIRCGDMSEALKWQQAA
jgi:hypothetical protein